MNLKPLRKRLEEVSKKDNLRLDVVQLDYLLSWLLVAIFQHPHLKSSLIFKGGTALKKCYFGEYRFSEDLDFSAQTGAPFGENLLRVIFEVCQNAERQMNEYAPIRLVAKRYEEKNPHPNDQEAFIISAQFPWMSEPLTTAMIEISRDELVLLDPITKPLIHNYGEFIEQQLYVYPLEEIVLEKLRAILQRTKKLHETNWCRSTVRHYYDLWRIFSFFGEGLYLDEVLSNLEKKCAIKKVNFYDTDSFFDPNLIKDVSKTWTAYLAPLVSQLPECHQVIEELKIKVKLLFENSSKKQMPSIIHLMAKGTLKGEVLYKTLEKIIRSGANVNQETSNGHRFLQLLINAQLEDQKKFELVKLAVNHGAAVDTPDISGLTPYGTAIRNTKKMIADFLRSKGARDQIPSYLHPQYYHMYSRFPHP